VTDTPAPPPAATPPSKKVIAPGIGEAITNTVTGNTYTMGEQLGEGNFGIVFSCVDVWNNNLAAKILKPKGTS
jgi:hypothetical protein